MVFFFLHKEICCGYALEEVLLISSTYIFFWWRNKKNITTFWLKKNPPKQQQQKKKQKKTYLVLCSTFNIKTTPLIRPLLGSTKVVFIVEIYCTLKKELNFH